MPIALLKFPYDLLQDVFQQCNPYELYCLSKCSKRTQKSITLGGTRNNWKISVSSLKSILVHCGKDSYVFRHTTHPYQYFKTRREFESVPSSYMPIDIPVGGFIDVFLYFLDTFRINSVEWLGNTEENMDALLQIGKITVQRNIEIGYLFIYDLEDETDVMGFMALTNQMNITNGIRCWQTFPSNFQHKFTRYPKWIHLKNSFWFNAEQLLNCPCIGIELGDSSFSNRDLNVFLQKWKKAGEFPNLRSLKIESKNINDQIPILGMIPPIENVEHPRVSVSFNGGNRMFNPVRITKDDGTVAWLKVELGKKPRFQFIV
ncbi:hypothetical protein B9Z55_003691 [Caenorhabditis nigoni]|uniref:F-box domain-containing protein n=1 Tax=Caenorhabditis nigoni TaxID=1611254 RepID=A0A2G5VRN3_9PELO|nr:hypothetical protein B9Z55_003691 [Caenorhabditis nigoni]